MLFLAFLSYFAAAGAQLERDGRQSIFQIVRFPNEVCASSSGVNGTCYTASECTSKAERRPLIGPDPSLNCALIG